MSSVQEFREHFLDTRFRSGFIERYLLLPPYAYTSGDGHFRSDGELGRRLKFFRFTKNFPTTDARFNEKLSISWRRNITEEEKNQLRLDYQQLVEQNRFSVTQQHNGTRIRGNAVQFIKFYGEALEQVGGSSIRSDIHDTICRMPCVNCGTSNSVECDHKNDLFLENEPRISRPSEQTVNDFQPLCKHCNDVKREVKAKTLRENKRQPAPGFRVKFTQGDETFDRTDPNWWRGTYWGDVAAFKQQLHM